MIWFSVQIVAKKPSLRTLTSYPGIWRVVSGAIFSLEKKHKSDTLVTSQVKLFVLGLEDLITTEPYDCSYELATIYLNAFFVHQQEKMHALPETLVSFTSFPLHLRMFPTLSLDTHHTNLRLSLRSFALTKDADSNSSNMVHFPFHLFFVSLTWIKQTLIHVAVAWAIS